LFVGELPKASAQIRRVFNNAGLRVTILSRIRQARCGLVVLNRLLKELGIAFANLKAKDTGGACKRIALLTDMIVNFR
jgi:hypothetical protein